MFGLADAGQQDHGGVFLAQLCEQGEPARIGRDVEQHERGTPGPERQDRRFSVGLAQHLVAVSLEVRAEVIEPIGFANNRVQWRTK